MVVIKRSFGLNRKSKITCTISVLRRFPLTTKHPTDYEEVSVVFAGRQAAGSTYSTNHFPRYLPLEKRRQEAGLSKRERNAGKRTRERLLSGDNFL